MYTKESPYNKRPATESLSQYGFQSISREILIRVMFCKAVKQRMYLSCSTALRVLCAQTTGLPLSAHTALFPTFHGKWCVALYSFHLKESG